MNRSWKKLVVITLMCMAVIVNTVPVCAYTVEFDVTCPNDPKSPRSQKDDTEQLYYVTGLTFSSTNASLKCFSYLADYEEYKVSNSLYISADHRADYEAYTAYITPGTWCAMKSSSSLSGFRVTGRYCP